MLPPVSPIVYLTMNCTHLEVITTIFLLQLFETIIDILDPEMLLPSEEDRVVPMELAEMEKPPKPQKKKKKKKMEEAKCSER